MMHVNDIMSLKGLQEIVYVGNEQYKNSAVSYCVGICGKELPQEIKQGDFFVIDMEYEEERIKSFIKKLDDVKCAGVLFLVEKKHEESMITLVKQDSNRKFGYLITRKESNTQRQIMNQLNALLYLQCSLDSKTQAIARNLLYGDHSENMLDWVYLLSLSGIDVFQKYQAAIIEIEAKEEEKTLFYEKVCRELKKYAPELIFAIIEDQLIVILSEKLKEKSAEDVLHEIYIFATEQLAVKCRIAIGSACEGLEKINSSFGEALRTFDMIDIACNEKKVCTYDMLGVYQLIYELKNYDVCEKYFERMFAPLWAYDRENEAELFHTLEIYVMCDCILADAAERLFVHKNTMRNRLSKIEDIMGKSFNNVNDITEIITAFKIRRLTNVLNENKHLGAG